MKSCKVKILFSAVAALGLCLGANAQEKQAAKDKHPLWRVTSKQNSIYLLGSIHLLKEESYPLPAVIDKAFEECEVVGFEVDLAEMVSAAKQRLIMEKALLPAGQTLEGLLTKETYARLKTKAAEMRLSIAVLGRFRPWYVAVAISMEKLRRLGFSQENGVDMHYYNRALKAGKMTTGLETVEDQVAMFGKLTKDNQDEFLRQVLDDMDVIEKELSKIIKAWSAGDTKGINDTLLKSFKDHPKIREIVLTDRNRKWLVKIEQFLKGEKKHFIVVGTAHVVGKDSLVELLTKKGYTVEQL